ncbi:TPA: TetR/AcrR family transcriptional regulator [Legionella pneumophila]|nr:TetR/AcrR family transcriptional regulator [Legionella pneumophila]
MPYKQSSLNEQALEQSMHLFWKQGYFNTSIDELVQVSGLSRAAIYKQFGGKEGLFLAMLKRYRMQLTSQFLAPLQNQEQGVTAIITFFEQFIALGEQGQLQHGCFFIATASELPSHQQAIKDIIEAFVNELKTLFYQAMECGKAQKQLSQSLDSHVLSSFLVANIFGLFTLARASNNAHSVREQVSIIKQLLHTYLITP